MPSASSPHVGVRAPCQALRALCCFLLLAGQALLAADAARRNYDLPAGNAANALKLFSQQSGAGVIAGTDLVQGVRTNAVRGQLTAAEALERMLEGTGLVGSEDRKSGTFAVRKATSSEKNVQRAALPPSSDRPRNRSNERNPEEGDTVTLSPFEVSAQDDVGYQASNTTSGSRLNSRLKDTPATITPFTAEFLSDIGATNLEEMLAYGTDIEADFDDSVAGFSNTAGGQTGGNQYSFRMRGMPAGASRDFVDSGVSVDLYNVERADVASGPNAILFGLGSPGGNVGLTSKRAALNRDRSTISAIHGSWDYRRYEADLNRALIPARLAVRLLGLYQDARGWRKWDLNEQKRIGGAVTYQPFARTTVRGSFETGNTVQNLSIRNNANDQVTTWKLSGRPIVDGVAVPGTARYSTTADRFTFNVQDGKIYNFRGELQSVRTGTPTLATTDVMPYEYNLTGPGALRYQTLQSQQVQIEQRVTRDLVLELGYFRNKASVRADGINLAAVELRADPNLTIPASDGSATTVPNPHAGQFYMDATSFRDFLTSTNEVIRGSAAWDINLGPWLGRHRLAGLLENAQSERLRLWKNEILVDSNNVPVSATVEIPEGAAAGSVFHRHYFAEGDFNNYHVADQRISPPSYTYNGRQLSSRFVSRAKAALNTAKDIDSAMLAGQSFWFKERLASTLGYRMDRITFKRANLARVTNPNDPRVLSRQDVLNEWDFDGTFNTQRYTAKTLTAGAVLHATRRISLFYNFSKNVGAPFFDVTILPHGNVPPPIDGKGKDMGVMLDFFGDDRFFLRATYFDTRQFNEAIIRPDGIAVQTSGSLGGDNLFNILDALRTAGRMSQAQYDEQHISFTAATTDTFTRGVEVELVANPTRNWTMRLGFSKSDRERTNFYKEVFAFYRPKYDEWRRLAAGNTALLTTVNNEIGLIEDELQAQVDRQNSPFATRPIKVNATTRYKFSEGKWKGLFVGGGARYQGKNFMQRDLVTGREYYGNETLFFDAFTGYRMRLPWLKRPLSFQLNVKNLSNSYLVVPGRLNATFDGLLKVYLNEPRSYRLTTSLEF
jgi:iron complex outermembrane receptor protein